VDRLHLGRLGWTEAEINKSIELYRDYLYLRFMHQDTSFPPSYEMDMVWRTHILHTKNYREFCERLFNDGYLDRTIEITSPELDDATKYLFDTVTQDLYYKEFQKTVPNIFGRGPLSKATRKFRKVWAKWLTATVVITVLGTTFNLVSSHNKTIDERYSELKASIRSVSYDEEESFLLCKSHIQKQYPLFFIKALYESHLSRRKNFADYLNVIINLKQDGYVTKESYDRLISFSRRTNRLYVAGTDICSLKLRNLNEIYTSRKKLIDYLWNSRRHFLWL